MLRKRRFYTGVGNTTFPSFSLTCGQKEQEIYPQIQGEKETKETKGDKCSCGGDVKVNEWGAGWLEEPVLKRNLVE